MRELKRALYFGVIIPDTPAPIMTTGDSCLETSSFDMFDVEDIVVDVAIVLALTCDCVDIAINNNY